MPGSEVAKFGWLIPHIANLGIERPRILDVGTGRGLLIDYLYNGFVAADVDGIEVWEPYIQEFNLRGKYNNLFVMDCREFTQWLNYDVVMFGDVLEHMPKEDAVQIWNAAEGTHRYISIPTVYCPQGHEHGNPYEAHVTDDWTHKEVLETFSGIKEWSPQYALVRAYYA